MLVIAVLGLRNSYKETSGEIIFTKTRLKLVCSDVIAAFITVVTVNLFFPDL